MSIRNPIHHKALRTVVCAVEGINGWLERCRIRVYAAQAAFFILISSIPMLILVLSLLGLLLPSGDSAVYDMLEGALSGDLLPLARRLLREIESKASGELLSLSAATLLWSASRGVKGIGAGIRNVCGGKQTGGWLRYQLRSLFYTLLYIVSVLLALTVWVFGDTILAEWGAAVPSDLLRILNRGAFFFLLVTVFLLTYCGFAGRTVSFGFALPGAVFSACGWLLYSRFFEYYVEHYAGYSAVYGSLTSLIVVMLWLYACMEILLVGAGLNCLIEQRVSVL
ncbi:MAG: YihY/virulence factor BrkB family protein [Ruminococcaceae bacterium]|nr:YihY/virulence factor BrkB family protein [Oscillospiraceae bacterium]